MNQEDKDYENLVNRLLQQSEGVIAIFRGNLMELKPQEVYQLNARNLMKGITAM